MTKFAHLTPRNIFLCVFIILFGNSARAKSQECEENKDVFLTRRVHPTSEKTCSILHRRRFSRNLIFFDNFRQTYGSDGGH